MKLSSRLEHHAFGFTYCRRTYVANVIVYSMVALAVAVGIYTEEFSLQLLWLVPYGLIFPHLLFLLKDLVPASLIKDNAFNQINLDSINFSLFACLMGYSVVPSLFLSLILLFSSIIRLGIKVTGSILVLTGCYSMAWYLLLNPAWQPHTSVYVATVCMAMGLAYMMWYAYFINMQNMILDFTQQEIRIEKEKNIQLANDLAKYLSPQIWQMIFSGKRSVKLETQRKRLSVFFSDIKGFTSFSEEIEAEELTEILNSYLEQMSQIALEHGGTIDKFVGDSVMVFFGDPSTRGAKKDAIAAVSMAISMRKHMNLLRQHWRTQGIERNLEVRMGINTGYCTVGNFGCDVRMDYTIIGREVNLASRLENYAEAGEILISHETYSLVQDKILCRCKGEVTVKGFSRPVMIYQVVDFREDLGIRYSFLEHELPGFSMYLDTDVVHSYDKDRIILALGQAAKQLQDHPEQA
ncbi:adenylate/guanylate cyclase domain-containing protein [Thiopseudomonas alkaliphila]|uniref:adenylate/guanylate cyclase domain-containing protein n=1 Tax=Thiopseudomonas alkaliphila TaxID=1697053 RepID=UPI00257837ED|nr:adenylate/guanylate cyclase domain-containing protein [Thiopseudomonas alkaliphila]MDM1707287.1 adenylate cyclase [Thiopseudomonas alkaliphila]